MQPVKKSVSLIVKDTNSRFLVVKRPEADDDELSGVWGFPAVSLSPEESVTDGAHRIARSKLGVEVALTKELGKSVLERDNYTLHMVDYEGTIVQGKPHVPQADTTVTQYTECKFSDDPSILFDAARLGSQCTQIFLRSRHIDW